MSNRKLAHLACVYIKDKIFDIIFPSANTATTSRTSIQTTAKMTRYLQYESQYCILFCQ